MRAGVVAGMVALTLSLTTLAAPAHASCFGMTGQTLQSCEYWERQRDQQAREQQRQMEESQRQMERATRESREQTCRTMRQTDQQTGGHQTDAYPFCQ